MKKYFATGLVILLPLALTLWILWFIINFLTAPFVGLIQQFLARYDLLDSGFLFLTGSQVQSLVAQILILIFLFFVTIILGFITRLFLFRSLMRFWDSLIHRIPLVSSIYKMCQDVIHALFTANAQSFKQVVLAPFPHLNARSIGFITRNQFRDLENFLEEDLVAVFLPTAPNPTSGYLTLFKKKDLIYIDMPVDEAFKYVISCGIIPAPITPLPPEKENSYEPPSI